MSPYLSRNQAQEKLIGSKRPFEICPIQISGVNMRTWKNAPDSLRSVIENTQSYGESEFMICGERRVSYADHFSSVCKLSNYLNLTLGISKGDRVILVMRNLPEWSVSFWAITALGAIVVPLNAWLLERELSYCINDCKAKVAILDFKRAEILRPSYSQLGLKTIIIPNPQKNRLLSSEISFENVINASSLEIKLPAAEILPDDDATIFYTSGTTGQPKGAVGSNRNICVNIFSSNFRASVRQLCRGVTPKALGGGPSQAKILVPVPFFHVTGCHAILAAGVPP